MHLDLDLQVSNFPTEEFVHPEMRDLCFGKVTSDHVMITARSANSAYANVLDLRVHRFLQWEESGIARGHDGRLSIWVNKEDGLVFQLAAGDKIIRQHVAELVFQVKPPAIADYIPLHQVDGDKLSMYLYEPAWDELRRRIRFYNDWRAAEQMKAYVR